MDEYNRTTCLQNTRLNVIKDVMEWIADDSDDGKKILWVYGLAGTGKSTLCVEPQDLCWARYDWLSMSLMKTWLAC
jgi:ATP-dependent phosphoenolpyruvate carboxykinase